MRHVMVYDDVRFIWLAVTESRFTHEEYDHFALVRPFRHDGEKVVCDHENAINVVLNNLKFDAWILDNDLGPGIEGYDFLKKMVSEHPEKVPDIVRSCSSNFDRRRQIESYHHDFLRTR
jgi:hypothetical protein